MSDNASDIYNAKVQQAKQQANECSKGYIGNILLGGSQQAASQSIADYDVNYGLLKQQLAALEWAAAEPARRQAAEEQSEKLREKIRALGAEPIR